LIKRPFEGKRILVTGAKGFVGSHLCAELIRQGAEVIALDLKGGNAVDIRDWKQVKELGGRLGKIDLVFHLAALMFVPYSFENPRETYEVNILGTLNILELCRVANIDKLVFASSYVYGEPQYLPVDEEHPLSPTSPYARSKVIGENLCKAYHDDYALKCIILRPFNIYGDGQSDSFLIPSILQQLMSGKIELRDPEPKRDFLYISDLIEAYVKAGEYRASEFEIFNIGSGISYSVDGIVREIVKAWGSDVEVRYQHLRRKGEITDAVANIRKASTELGWEPRTNFTEGIKKYIRWYKNHMT
jgi:nucleoside-diphosphate-sugar epimerase